MTSMARRSRTRKRPAVIDERNGFGGAGQVDGLSLPQGRTGDRQPQGFLRRQPDRRRRPQRRGVRGCLLARLCQTSAGVVRRRRGEALADHVDRLAAVEPGHDRSRLDERRRAHARPRNRRPRRTRGDNPVQRLCQPPLAGQSPAGPAGDSAALRNRAGGAASRPG